LKTESVFSPALEAGSAPDSLTGLPCTADAPEAAVSVDWFSCTFPLEEYAGVENSVRALLVRLAHFVDDQEMLDYAKFGYSKMMRLNDGALLMWNPDRKEMGIHLEIPSSAFASFLAPQDTIEGLVHFLVHQLHGRPTRLDIAFDDFAGQLEIEDIRRWCEAGWLTSKWQIMRSENEFRHSAGNMLPRGRIIRFGRRESRSYCRIYDKRLEQLAMKRPCEHAHWHRVEIELKGVKAEAATELLFAPDRPDKLRGLLYAHLDFKVHDPNDSNTRRWNTVDWWLRFLCNVGKVQLSIPKPGRSIEKTGRWIEQYVLPSIALLVEALSDGDRAREIELFDRMVEDGKARWEEQHERMLREYRRGRQENSS